MSLDRIPYLNQTGQITLLIGLALVTVPFLIHLPVWIGMLLLVQLLIQATRLLGKKPPLAKSLLLVFVVVCLGCIYLEFKTLFGLGAGSALLLLMLGFKVLETRSYRDVMISLFLGYFAVTTAFLFNQSILLLPYLILSAFVLTLALHQINDLHNSIPLRRHLASTGFMFAMAAPVMVVLFVVFPRLSGPLWALPQAQSAKTGISDDMSPGDISQLIQSNAPAFRVTFNADRPPLKTQRYWRGPVLDQFDGKRWSAARSAYRRPLPKSASLGNTTEYTITMEPHNRFWVFPLDIPLSLPVNTVLDHNYVLRSRAPIKKLKQFPIISATNYRLTDAVTSRTQVTALQLPKHIAPKARELVSQLKTASTDTEDYVNRVLTYFNEQDFHYTLRPRQLAGDHTDDFLFSSRQGFCEHYASSFVVLMRLAGIPARVVTGYLGGQWNANARYLLVRQSDAHAWAEVWLENEGWIRVDPTAAIAPERIAANMTDALSDSDNLPILNRIGFLNQLSLKWDLINYYWGRWILSYDSGRQSRFLDRLGLSLNSVSQALYTLFAGAIVVAASWLFIFLLRYFRTSKDPVMISYNRFLHKMQRLGLVREPYETASKFAQRINATRPDLSNHINLITQRYQETRYRDDPDTGRIQELNDLVRKFRPKKSPQ